MQPAIIYCAFCLVIALLGRNRKFGFWGYLFSSVLFTPLIGFFLVIGSDPITPKVVSDEIEPEE